MWAVWRVHDVFRGGHRARHARLPARGRARPARRRDYRRHADPRHRAPTDAGDGTRALARPRDERKIFFGSFVPAARATPRRGRHGKSRLPVLHPRRRGTARPAPAARLRAATLRGRQPRPRPTSRRRTAAPLITGGTVSHEEHNATNWTKTSARPTPSTSRRRTPVEKVAIKYHGTRNHPSFTPEGTPATSSPTGSRAARN